MKWNANGTNDWTKAQLNTYLNNDYYNTLTSDAKNMIGTTKYYLGGYSNSKITSDTMWQYERKKANDTSGTYYSPYGTNPIMQNDASKKIAIMYASDYGYGASKECISILDKYDGYSSCKTPNNWLDKSENTWFLSQCSSNSSFAFFVYSTGFVSSYGIDVNGNGYEYATRPVLSLSSNVKISGGTGTSTDPYTLSLQ